MGKPDGRKTNYRRKITPATDRKLECIFRQVVAKSGNISPLHPHALQGYGYYMDNQAFPTIQDLYPHLTDEECAVAEDNLKRYLTLALRIYERKQVETDCLTTPADTIRYDISASKASSSFT